MIYKNQSLSIIDKVYHKIFSTFIQNKASDLHIVVNHPPCYRINGKMVKIGDKLTFPIVQALINRISETDNMHLKLLEKEEVDFTARIKINNNFYRFRVNIALSERLPYLTLRRLENINKKPYDLGVPSIFINESKKRSNGIIFVTGTTGSGKSTTLASLLADILSEKPIRVITLEDPIEYLIPSGKGLVSQREIGWDTISFATALRAAMRQDPDIILVGEIRDEETANAALTAAETGHLVFATLHVNSISLIPQRMIGFFADSPAKQKFILERLKNVFVCGLSQMLIPVKEQSNRILVWEFGDFGVADFFIKNDVSAMNKYLKQQKTSMSDVLARLVVLELISFDSALSHTNQTIPFTPQLVKEYRNKFDNYMEQMKELYIKSNDTEEFTIDDEDEDFFFS